MPWRRFAAAACTSAPALDSETKSIFFGRHMWIRHDANMSIHLQYHIDQQAITGFYE